ncbi:addiction module protein [Rubripirellula sp.]|jgi:putative addiction module component (TIGR02574 family)|nr:addiction module protein [Rubripirellula sp.]
MTQDISVESLSLGEKLQLMESLWTSLCDKSTDIQSPQWHQDILSERRRQLEAGDAKVSSWNDAKARLSKLGQ